MPESRRPRRVPPVAALLVGLAPCVVTAQVRVDGAVLWESYSFDGALLFADVAELSLPIFVATALGARGELAVATAYTRVRVTLADQGGSAEMTLTGLADTEIRLSLNLIRDRLMLVATGAIPTGMETLEVQEQEILNLLVTDVLGFYTQRLGSGGSIGGGLAAAFPAGPMAVGLAGTFTSFGSYEPVPGQLTLEPGSEVRLRAGIEGSLGERTYLRVALMFGRRGIDRIGGSDLGGVGNRLSGYASLEQGVGSTTLNLYAFDLFRTDPEIGTSTLGTSLPRGNLLALGGRLTVPLGRAARATPRVEWRRSTRAVDVTTTTLQAFGDALRFGADLSLALGTQVDLVLQGDGLTGSVQGGVADVSGYRLGVSLSVRP